MHIKEEEVFKNCVVASFLHRILKCNMYTIFDVFEKIVPSASTTICRVTVHPCSQNCFRSFKCEFGEVVRSCSIVLPTKNDLGGLLVYIYGGKDRSLY